MLLAIDPGLQGACALFDADGLVAVIDFQVMRDQRLAWIDAKHLCARIEDHSYPQATLTGDRWVDEDRLRERLARTAMPGQFQAIIERAQPNPKNGAIAVFSQGLTLGSLLVIMQQLGASIEFVSPGSWKAALGLSFPKGTSVTRRKDASLCKARLLYPQAPLDRAKDHNRAEAILIGHWYRTRTVQLPMAM